VGEARSAGEGPWGRAVSSALRSRRAGQTSPLRSAGRCLQRPSWRSANMSLKNPRAAAACSLIASNGRGPSFGSM